MIDWIVVLLRLAFIALIFVAAIATFGVLRGSAIGGAIWMFLPVKGSR